MRWRTAAQTSPSSWGEAILLCSTEIIANPFKWKGFLSAGVITRYAARVWWRRGGKRRRKHDRQVLKFNGWGRKEVERDVLKQRECCWSLRLGLKKDMFMVWGLVLFWSGRETLCQEPESHLLQGNLLRWWGDLCGVCWPLFLNHWSFFRNFPSFLVSQRAQLNNSWRQHKLHSALPSRCVEECLSVMMERLKSKANCKGPWSSPQSFVQTLPSFRAQLGESPQVNTQAQG